MKLTQEEVLTTLLALRGMRGATTRAGEALTGAIEAVLALADAQAAIKTYNALLEYAMQVEEPVSLIENWVHGEFDQIRAEWHEPPEAMFPASTFKGIGQLLVADPPAVHGYIEHSRMLTFNTDKER